MNSTAKAHFADRRLCLARRAAAGVRISFEFFPPKTPAAEARLWQTVERLQAAQPALMSR